MNQVSSTNPSISLTGLAAGIYQLVLRDGVRQVPVIQQRVVKR
jgi:hypothetical protein